MAVTSGSAVEEGPLPIWMRRLGAGLTGLVAVLLLVTMAQLRDQNTRLQSLQNRLQTLENARDLERTNALEEQVRTTTTRLQGLEGLEREVEALRSQQASLSHHVQSLPPPAPLGVPDTMAPGPQGSSPEAPGKPSQE